MPDKLLRCLVLVCAPLFLSACGTRGLLATVGPDYQPGPVPAAAAWQVAAEGKGLAHDGSPAELIHWWERFNDPVLTRILTAAEQESATVADAAMRIEQARANLVAAGAGLVPNLDASLSANRSSVSFGGTPFIWNQYSAGLQSSWEIDLFGGLAREAEAARSRYQGKQAAWHDARVAVAVEAANAYLAYRYCQSRVQLLRTDTDSRLQSAQLTALISEAGLGAPGDAALAEASAAEGERMSLQQQAECERTLKSLVAMTALDEQLLRSLLGAASGQAGQLPEPPAFRLDAIPARVLLQRPDVAAAEREVAEASANIGVQRAKQFPKLSLTGNITPTFQNFNGSALLLAETWAIGPTLSLPLFDRGKRAADVASAQAEYAAAESRFRSKVRTAVKEVEEALVRLASTDQRMPKADQAINGYKINLVGQQTLYQNGLGSLLDVETARRSLLSSELAQIELQQERVSAWIALYRAAGGGWQLPEDASRAATLPEGNLSDQGRHNSTSQSELPGGHS